MLAVRDRGEKNPALKDLVKVKRTVEFNQVRCNNGWLRMAEGEYGWLWMSDRVREGLKVAQTNSIRLEETGEIENDSE